jgi:hypothetical protein
LDGGPQVVAVLEAGDRWREHCFLGNRSVLTDGSLWTVPSLNDVRPVRIINQGPPLKRSSKTDKRKVRWSVTFKVIRDWLRAALADRSRRSACLR